MFSVRASLRIEPWQGAPAHVPSRRRADGGLVPDRLGCAARSRFDAAEAPVGARCALGALSSRRMSATGPPLVAPCCPVNNYLNTPTACRTTSPCIAGPAAGRSSVQAEPDARRGVRPSCLLRPEAHFGMGLRGPCRRSRSRARRERAPRSAKRERRADRVRELAALPGHDQGDRLSRASRRRRDLQGGARAGGVRGKL